MIPIRSFRPKFYEEDQVFFNIAPPGAPAVIQSGVVVSEAYRDETRFGGWFYDVHSLGDIYEGIHEKSLIMHQARSE